MLKIKMKNWKINSELCDFDVQTTRTLEDDAGDVFLERSRESEGSNILDCIDRFLI